MHEPGVDLRSPAPGTAECHRAPCRRGCDRGNVRCLGVGRVSHLAGPILCRGRPSALPCADQQSALRRADAGRVECCLSARCAARGGRMERALRLPVHFRRRVHRRGLPRAVLRHLVDVRVHLLGRAQEQQANAQNGFGAHRKCHRIAQVPRLEREHVSVPRGDASSAGLGPRHRDGARVLAALRHRSGPAHSHARSTVRALRKRHAAGVRGPRLALPLSVPQPAHSARGTQTSGDPPSGQRRPQPAAEATGLVGGGNK